MFVEYCCVVIVTMLKYNYPSSAWLLDFILHQKVNRSATTLHIIKVIAGPCPDGTKMMQVGDGELFLKAEFSSQAVHKLNSQSEVCWEDSLIKLQDWRMDLVLRGSKETSEYIIRVIDFTVWSDERGFAAKHSMVSCDSHPLIRENIARLFEENRPRIPPYVPDSNATLDSISLSILLEQMKKDNSNRTSSEDSAICAIPNGGRISSVSTVHLEKKLKAKNIRDVLIHPEDAKTLAKIWHVNHKSRISSASLKHLEKKLMTEDIRDVLIHPEDAKILAEIGDDFQVANNLQKKPSNSKANAGSSTFEHPSSKISPQTSSVFTPYEGHTRNTEVASAQPIATVLEMDTSAHPVSQQPSVIAPMNTKGDTSTRQVSQNSSKVAPCSAETRKRQGAPRQDDSEAEEEIRLFVLSRTSNEQAKRLPLKECEERNRSDYNSKTSAKTLSDPNRAITAGNTSNASAVNKDSAETSFEIPLSGKVASNTKLNKLNSDETDCNLLGSILDSSMENRVQRWNNLNLSSIESEAHSDLSHKASKKMKLSHAGESTSDPSQNQLLNQPPMKIYKPTLISKSSKSKTPELETTGSPKNDANKVSAVNSQTPSSSRSMISSKKTNLLTDSNDLLNIEVCENSVPVEPYATCHELFPKHPPCLSLLPMPNQLSAQNNLNGIVLNQNTMDSINTCWSASYKHIYERRYWKQ